MTACPVALSCRHRASDADAPTATTPRAFATAATAAHLTRGPRVGIAMPGALAAFISGSAMPAGTGERHTHKGTADPAPRMPPSITTKRAGSAGTSSSAVEAGRAALICCRPTGSANSCSWPTSDMPASGNTAAPAGSANSHQPQARPPRSLPSPTASWSCSRPPATLPTAWPTASPPRPNREWLPSWIST